MDVNWGGVGGEGCKTAALSFAANLCGQVKCVRQSCETLCLWKSEVTLQVWWNNAGSIWVKTVPLYINDSVYIGQDFAVVFLQTLFCSYSHLSVTLSSSSALQTVRRVSWTLSLTPPCRCWPSASQVWMREKTGPWHFCEKRRERRRWKWLNQRALTRH